MKFLWDFSWSHTLCILPSTLLSAPGYTSHVFCPVCALLPNGFMVSSHQHILYGLCTVKVTIDFLSGPYECRLALQVKRVQNLVESIDAMRGLRMQPHQAEPHPLMSTNWETFDNGIGSLSAPPASSPSMTTDWETFD